MQNGTQDSQATHNVSFMGEFPAEIASWLMSKYLNQIHFFQKLASWMLNLLTLLDGEILMTRWLPWWRTTGGFLSCQRFWSVRWKFAQCLCMVFPRKSSIVAFQDLEVCVEFPTKQPKRMHRLCFRHNVSMLWHCQREYGDCLDRGLCLCQIFVLVALQIFCHGTKYSDKNIVCVLSRSENPAFQ